MSNARTTDLYRFYDSKGRLLYIGVSFNTLTRMQQHMADKSWFSEVSDITIEKFDSREEATDAERRSIKIEMPMYNISLAPTVRVHTPRSHSVIVENQLAPAAHSVETFGQTPSGEDRLLKLKEVMKITSLGSSTIYRKLATNEFPQPLALSPACVRWRSSEVYEWMSRLMRRAS